MNISILGATGSIGRQTFEVVQALPNVQVTAMAAGSDYEALAKMAKVLQPKLLCMYNEAAAVQLRKLMPNTEVVAGMEGLLQCATQPDTQLMLNAVVGSIGLRPTLAAINAGKHIALANKETLVAAGSLVMAAAQANKVEIRPIDSEHSAIWQCLQGANHEDISRLILTASGGAFRDWQRPAIAQATAADALRHPNWAMGPKITIDCATMMNKGLEYIEAHWLFSVPYDKIHILVHPQSVIHSIVEFTDGASLAQMGAPDMQQPIQYALTAPARAPRPHIPFDDFEHLNFKPPDYQRFPCLALAKQAGQVGGTMPAMVNALNERLVAAFLENKLAFYDISGLIEKAMQAYTVKAVSTLEDVEQAESWAEEFYNRENLCQ